MLTHSPSTPVSPQSKTTKEPLLPHALGHVLRQRAWLLREAGALEEYDAVLQQLDRVPRNTGDKVSEYCLSLLTSSLSSCSSRRE